MNNKTKLIFIFWILLSLPSLVQADTSLWQEIHAQARSNNTSAPFNNSRKFILDEDKMQQLLKLSSQSRQQQAKTTRKEGKLNTIALPLPNGKTIFVTAVASEVLPPLLAEKYPQIKTYKLISADNEIINGRLDFTPSGFHAMLQTDHGQIIYIDPVSIDSSSKTNHRHYYSYQQKDQKPTTSHQCDLNNELQSSSSPTTEPSTYRYRSSKSSNNKNLHHYRIAIATTGEYTELQGGSVASTLGAIATTINRINQIYERDLGIHLTLVNHNDRIIYSNADSDPYSNGKSHLLILENQQTLDNMIGKSNYDIGHVFGTSSGGLAIVDSLCSSNAKAKGTSGISNPNSENFYIDFVAHEIGHQLGATHTFNGKSGLCAGNTRTARTAFEPGSGSTIMAYTGICGSDNLQSQADAMFHIGSIEQIKKNLDASCGTHSVNPNQAPIVNAGNDYTIPAETPFILQGAANDPENDTLSYSWQQIDTGNSSSVNHDLSNNALFRAYLPNSSTSRTFPILSDILSHQRTKGEMLPNTQRSLTFKLTAQDGNKNTNSDQITVQIEHTGSRFALDLPYSHYTIGESTELTWNVAKTKQAPIACTDIDIYLSTNSGKTFNTLLATNIINNGKASVYIPNNISPNNNGRFKIACSNNIFFSISYHDFTLGYIASDHQTPPPSEPNLIIKANVQTLGETNLTQTSYQKMEAGTFNSLILLLILFILRKNKKRENEMRLATLNAEQK
jgi:hypothetical protein